MFIFSKRDKNADKNKQNFFFGGPEKFDLALTYFYQGWKIRVT